MDKKYLTVTAITRYMKRKFELDNNLKNVWLKGEISNLKLHSRGHMYLTVKDDYSKIQAVMFAGNNRHLKFQPKNGMNVLITGDINIYEPQGQYQLYISEMEPDGIGALYAAYEQLKEKLQKEGLFDVNRKKVIPSFPAEIGVVTSPTGAAVRDIITTIKRRYPLVKITILPVLVQGDHAPKSIAKAIKFANKMNRFDVLIVGRGGGSIEELWGFNEEVVARAIADSSIPIISAVGHETDFTISDFVADMRAATPTGAAELAVPDQHELKNRVMNLKKSLNMAFMEKRNKSHEQLHQLNKSYAFKYPTQLLRQKEQELDRLLDNLDKTMTHKKNQKSEQIIHLSKRLAQQHPSRQIQQLKQHLVQIDNNAKQIISTINQKEKTRYNALLDKLSILNPLNTMKRGYSIAYTKENDVIQTTKEVQPGQQISVRLVDGTLDCQVWGIEEESKDGKG